MSPRASWPGPDPGELTGWLVVQAGHAVGRRFWTELGRLGLTPIQLGVLLQLDLEPDVSNAELARITFVTPQTMSELLRGLEREGLVSRDRTGGRGRRIPARLTAAGRERLRRSAEAVGTVERGLDLEPGTASDLRGLLRPLLGTPAPPDTDV